MDTELLVAEATTLIVFYGQNLLFALLIFIAGRWLAGKISRFFVKRLEAKGIDAAVTQFAGSLSSTLIVAFTLVAVLGQLGVETASMVAALGAMGLAIGLSLQGSLSNFAAGILIIMFKPCRVGDYIDAAGVSGTVSDINLLATTLLTPDNKSVVVPNSALMSGSVTNYSKMPTRRVDLVIGVSYEADLAATKAVLERVVAADSRVLQDPAVTIAVSELADSSVNFVVRPWVASGDYWPTYFALLENIKNALDEAGIGIPYPQVDLHVQK